MVFVQFLLLSMMSVRVIPAAILISGLFFYTLMSCITFQGYIILLLTNTELFSVWGYE